MTRRILQYSILPIAALALNTACSKNRAAQNAAALSHNAAQCPHQIQEGRYTTSGATTAGVNKSITVKDDKAAQHLLLSLDDNLDLTVDGKEAHPPYKSGNNKSGKPNQADLTASCISNDIEIVGKMSNDPDAKTERLVLTYNDKDQTIKLSGPNGDFLYHRASGLDGAVNQVGNEVKKDLEKVLPDAVKPEALKKDEAQPTEGNKAP